MISNDVLKHVNKCLKKAKEQRGYSTKGYDYTNLEIAAFASIIFNEKYTEDDIHDIYVTALRKIKKILHTNRELKGALLEHLTNYKSGDPDYSHRYVNLSFERMISEL